ncbi:MAG: hypothetical protein L6R37_008350, partial [Teloschistes peruensis]
MFSKLAILSTGLLVAFAAAAPADNTLASRQTQRQQIIVRVFTGENKVNADGTTVGTPLTLTVAVGDHVSGPYPQNPLPASINNAIRSVGLVAGPYNCFFTNDVTEDGQCKEITGVPPAQRGVDCVDYRG